MQLKVGWMAGRKGCLWSTAPVSLETTESNHGVTASFLSSWEFSIFCSFSVMLLATIDLSFIFNCAVKKTAWKLRYERFLIQLPFIKSLWNACRWMVLHKHTHTPTPSRCINWSLKKRSYFSNLGISAEKYQFKVDWFSEILSLDRWAAKQITHRALLFESLSLKCLSINGSLWGHAVIHWT